jgi:hypothetical protein
MAETHSLLPPRGSPKPGQRTNEAHSHDHKARSYDYNPLSRSSLHETRKFCAGESHARRPSPLFHRHENFFTMPTSTYQRDLMYPYNLNRPVLEHGHFWRGRGNPPPGSAYLAVRGFKSVGNAFPMLRSGAREHVWEAERDGDKGHSIKA